MLILKKINSQSREEINSIFWDFIANKYIPKKDTICHVCGMHFQSSKNKVFTHSDACSTKKCHIVKNLNLISVNDKAFLQEFK